MQLSTDVHPHAMVIQHLERKSVWWRKPTSKFESSTCFRTIIGSQYVTAQGAGLGYSNNFCLWLMATTSMAHNFHVRVCSAERQYTNATCISGISRNHSSKDNETRAYFCYPNVTNPRIERWWILRDGLDGLPLRIQIQPPRLPIWGTTVCGLPGERCWWRQLYPMRTHWFGRLHHHWRLHGWEEHTHVWPLLSSGVWQLG